MRKIIAVILTVAIAACAVGCKGDTEYIYFHDMALERAALSRETIEWLERYNELTEEEQLSISYIPGEIHSILYGGAADGVEAAAETGS